jgi:Fe-Mn family superoxide dismutase
MHFKLYEGYVKETNRLNEHISEFLKDGQVDQEEMPAYSELTRRLGFEYNGMVLHEYYFENLTNTHKRGPVSNSAFHQAAEASFGSYDVWKADFMGVGKCGASDGRSVLRILAIAAYQITGSLCTKSAMWQGLRRCW